MPQVKRTLKVLFTDGDEARRWWLEDRDGFVVGQFGVYLRQDQSAEHGYTVVHVASGFKCMTLPSEGEAVRLAGLLNRCGDWSDVTVACDGFPTGGGEIRKLGFDIITLVRQKRWEQADKLATRNLLLV